MIIATLALFKRNIILCLAASCFGLLVREYLIIPPIILLYILFNEYIKEHSKSTALWMIIVLFSVSLTFLLPRILIPVLETSSYTYPISNKESLTGIIKQPILLKKDLNILLGVIGYLLPIILLATKERLKHAWIQLAGYRPFLLIYSAIVLLLTFFLGSDIMRYVTYLFVPQVIFISILLNNGVDKREIIFMLIAVAIYNRIFLQIPTGNINLYLDFVGAYGTRINIASIKHLFELMVYVLLAIF